MCEPCVLQWKGQQLFVLLPLTTYLYSCTGCSFGNAFDRVYTLWWCRQILCSKRYDTIVHNLPLVAKNGMKMTETETKKYINRLTQDLKIVKAVPGVGYWSPVDRINGATENPTPEKWRTKSQGWKIYQNHFACSYVSIINFHPTTQSYQKVNNRAMFLCASVNTVMLW